MLDPTKNFAKVEVSTGYDAAAVSIVLETDEGAKLPDPSVDGEFNLVWWNWTDYRDPSDDPNVEIVRCTAKSVDTLTVERAQESTAASTKNTADKTYKMILTPTKKTIDDLDIHKADAKTTPANDDEVGLLDSAASYVLKKLTWANIKATLKTYFDSLYDKSATTSAEGYAELATDAEALAGSSDSVVLTPGNLGYTGFLTGWIPAGETWTYASATTFTISGSDETDKFTKGTKIKLTNDSSTKYFYVVSSSFSTNTTVTVTGETDLVSGAITNPYYSYADCPQGFKKGEDWYKCIVGDLSSTQSLTTTLTTVVFTDDTYNPNSSYNTSTGQFTAPISGYYSIKTLLRIDKAAVGDSILVVYQPSTSSLVSFDHLNNYDTSVMYANNTADIYLVKGETLVVNIRNTTSSRGKINDVGGLGYNRFSVLFTGL